jgi:nitrogen-specific signal transduction histidine kinase/CheY-like chemotaxis protein
LIDEPTSWSFLVAGLAGLGCILLGGVLVVLVLRDMADRRRAEETLRQSQKMEAVGQLTGGIAHDFNNLLTAIMGNLDLIRSRGAGNERLQRLADHALEAARRGAKLTAQLLAFSRHQRMSLAPVELTELLNGMSVLLTQSVGPSIQVKTDISPDANVVLSDANQLELALLNLCVNARDAMPRGGTLCISSRRASDLDLRHLAKQPYVEIRVSDTGIGMNEEIRGRAMEPFFTTKPVGEGTGLGLSQVYGIVRESGGTVLIDSDVNQGTTVRLILPAAIAKRAAPEIEHRSPPTVPGARPDSQKIILVVDDDNQVRRFIVESLRGLGYQVHAAAAGQAGLTILNEVPVDLLLVDFAMPGMNGAEVARAALAKRPDLPVLMVSGYADSAAVEAVAGTAKLLRKPFDFAELGAAVAELLKRG